MIRIGKKQHPRFTEEQHVDQFSGHQYSIYCVDGEPIGVYSYDYRHIDWLSKLDDNALTAIRDCFAEQRKQQEAQDKERYERETLIKAGMSACL